MRQPCRTGAPHRPSDRTGPQLGRAAVVLVLLLLPFVISAPASAKSSGAPPPSDVSSSDVRHLKKSLEALSGRQWHRAAQSEARIKDPVARKIVAWARLLAPESPATFEEFTRFRLANPGWPGQKILTARTEGLVPSALDAEAALDWFQRHPPETDIGRLRHAELMLNAGQRTRGIRELKALWAEGEFTRAEQSHILKRHGKRLSADDHWKRLDRMLWEGRLNGVRRLMWRVPQARQRLAEARLLLRQRRGNVDRAISRVPARYRDDMGLVYERVKWRRRKNKESAIQLLRGVPPTAPRAEKWWDERAILSRRALRLGYITDAYTIASNHGLEEGAGFADGEWLAGWIALRFLNEPEDALRHFQRLYERVQFPISRARGAYWTARALEALGRRKEAVDWHQRAARHPTTYYGQISAATFRPGAPLDLPPPARPTREDKKRFQAHELTRAVALLDRAGQEKRLKAFYRKLLEAGAGDKAWAMLTAEHAHKAGHPHLAIGVAKASDRAGLSVPDAGYPRVQLPRFKKSWPLRQPEKALTLGIIRQESAFRTSAVSRAGARGLMQLLPSTAKGVAKKLRIRYSKKQLNRDLKLNMTLGQAYLAELIERYNGSYILALAAYNAGPGRANRWIDNFGDPRKPGVDPIDWVEMIALSETRNYVQRVMENLHVYRAMLSPTQISLAPETDLKR